MKALKCTAALAAIAAPLLLAACGGGGGGGSSGGPAGPGSALGQAAELDPTAARSAVGKAGKASPEFGSVFQSSEGQAPSVTFDGSRVGLSVGSILSLNSNNHAFDTPNPQQAAIGTHTRAQSWGLVSTTSSSLSGAAVLVSWNEADATDWLAAGFWLHATGDPTVGRVDSMAAGAFIDGPEIDADRATMPTTGTATYEGVAGGIYAYGNPMAGQFDVGEVDGNIQLTAEFAGTATISGSITGIGPGVNISLGSAPIASTGKIAEGPVSLTIDGTVLANAGKWGGRFSEMDAGGQPRLVAGTAGAEWSDTASGNQGAFVGAFVAAKTE